MKDYFNQAVKKILPIILKTAIKMIGEKISDKIARALLIGIAAAIGYYFDISQISFDVL